ncbi:MAG TPA: methyltransferase domain-containing protein [Mycobacteriales bacterium]|nr:methyltransferase domain-containing protein [Mycobacteriales bacterium]
MSSFDDLVAEAVSARRVGWDFSFQRGRTAGGDLPWSYVDQARSLVAAATSLLDQDTGGGEILAGLAPLPPHSVATEPWEPNVPVARERLEPLGVEVRFQPDRRIPAADGEFDLVLNRHGAINAAELARVLDSGGRFLSQQVGSRNNSEFNEFFGVPLDGPSTVDQLVDALERQGLELIQAEAVGVPFIYLDIAAVVFQLLTVSWTVPGFTVKRYEQRLRELDRRIRAEGGFTVHDERYLLEAVKTC